MGLPDWLGVAEKRWPKSATEELRPAKTAWDVLQLLIIPVVVVLIALYFNASQASRNRNNEDRRAREDRTLAEGAREDATLDAYIANMSGLILDRALLKAEPGSAVRQVARTATLATVRRLSGSRKGEVVRFLYEAGLLRVTRSAIGFWSAPVINLTGADLRGVNLANASLSPLRGYNGVAFRGDLRGARFDHAELRQVHFSDPSGRGTTLRGASFNGASIDSTWLSSVDLRGASFRGARLFLVNFGGSDLTGAVFDKAFILPETTFVGTCISDASFVGATFNVDPDGGRYAGNPTTTFIGAHGQDVDFSNAVNLSSVRLGVGVTNARFDGADERPKTAPARTLDPFMRLRRCK
jgi:uncharacterized protein YjbI with pentapeptide repeats